MNCDSCRMQFHSDYEHKNTIYIDVNKHNLIIMAVSLLTPPNVDLNLQWYATGLLWAILMRLHPGKQGRFLLGSGDVINGGEVAVARGGETNGKSYGSFSARSSKVSSGTGVRPGGNWDTAGWELNDKKRWAASGQTAADGNVTHYFLSNLRCWVREEKNLFLKGASFTVARKKRNAF